MGSGLVLQHEPLQQRPMFQPLRVEFTSGLHHATSQGDRIEYRPWHRYPATLPHLPPFLAVLLCFAARANCIDNSYTSPHNSYI